MNIYNKVTLSVILVITILISFTFYFFNKEDKPDKDDLYENKIANRKSATSDEQKTYGVASNNAIATRVGNKIIEDGGNAVDAAEGVAYALAVTEHLPTMVKMVKNLACMNIKQHLHLITKREIK